MNKDLQGRDNPDQGGTGKEQRVSHGRHLFERFYRVGSDTILYSALPFCQETKNHCLQDARKPFPRPSQNRGLKCRLNCRTRSRRERYMEPTINPPETGQCLHRQRHGGNLRSEVS